MKSSYPDVFRFLKKLCKSKRCTDCGLTFPAQESRGDREGTGQVYRGRYRGMGRGQWGGYGVTSGYGQV